MSYNQKCNQSNPSYMMLSQTIFFISNPYHHAPCLFKGDVSISPHWIMVFSLSSKQHFNRQYLLDFVPHRNKPPLSATLAYFLPSGIFAARTFASVNAIRYPLVQAFGGTFFQCCANLGKVPQKIPPIFQAFTAHYRTFTNTKARKKPANITLTGSLRSS